MFCDEQVEANYSTYSTNSTDCGQFKYTRLKLKEETNYIQRAINNQIIDGQVRLQSNCLVVDLYTHAASFPEVVPTLAH